VAATRRLALAAQAGQTPAIIIMAKDLKLSQAPARSRWSRWQACHRWAAGAP
jgi:hypothetical protein